jgi:hypothetical protein
LTQFLEKFAKDNKSAAIRKILYLLKSGESRKESRFSR